MSSFSPERSYIRQADGVIVKAWRPEVRDRVVLMAGGVDARNFLVVNPGDWVVEEPSASTVFNRYPVSDALFQAGYAEVS